MVNSKFFFSKTIIENGVYFPAERKAFVPDHQHGRHELRCKTVIFIWKDKGREKVVRVGWNARMGYSFLTRRPQSVICLSLETHTRFLKKLSKLESILYWKRKSIVLVWTGKNGAFQNVSSLRPQDKSIAQITEFENVSRDNSFRWLRVEGRRLCVNASTDAEISMRYR